MQYAYVYVPSIGVCLLFYLVTARNLFIQYAYWNYLSMDWIVNWIRLDWLGLNYWETHENRNQISNEKGACFRT